MPVEVFKTNVSSRKNADKVLCQIRDLVPAGKINFDLDDCDRILRVEAHEIRVQPILDRLLELGFACTPLE